MSWLGIGYISQSRKTPGGGSSRSLPKLAPGPDYDGTEASGFAATPSDPARTTAKPAVRLLTPPNQHFTSTIDVGVIAAANNQGTLGDTLGIDKIVFHYEGNTVEVTEPKWYAFPTERGARIYFGWWVRLNKPLGKTGTGHLYVEAVPLDTAMQNRVIGPYNFSPVDTLHDFTATVSTQGELQTAIANARAAAAQNPLFTIDTAGLYDLGTDVGTNSYDITGRYTIRASTAGVSLGKPGYTGDSDAVLQSQRTWWRFAGSNLTFDSAHAANLGAPVSAGNNAQHWMDGITLTSSHPDGKNQLVRGLTPQRGARLIQGEPYFTECDFTAVTNQANYASMVRGCSLTDTTQDCISNVLCAVSNTFSDHDQTFWNGDDVALTVQYTGAEASATLSRSGGNVGNGGGLFTCTIGATSYTFDVGHAQESYWPGSASYPPVYNGADGVGGYWCADVVAWLNTLPGVTATLSAAFTAEDRVAAALSLAGLKGQGFGGGGNTNSAVDIKTAPVDLVWNIDTHGDWYQHTSGRLENVVVAFNIAFDMETQVVFLSPILNGGVASTRDVTFIGNLHSNKAAFEANLKSQFIRSQEFGHVVFAHNTFANSGLFIGSQLTDEGYSLLTNNAWADLQWDAATVPGITIKNLRVHAAAPDVQGAEPSVQKLGDAATLYTDHLNGDFAPTALATAEGFPPSIPSDRNRTVFPDPCVAGGVAAAAAQLYVPPGPGAYLGPQGQATAALLFDKTNSGMWDMRKGVLDAGTLTIPSITGGLADLAQGNATNQPTIDAVTGAHFDSAKKDYVQAAAVGTFSIFMLMRRDPSDTGSGYIINQNTTGLYLAQAGSGVGVPTMSVDGAAVTTRGALHTAITGTAFRSVEMPGVALGTVLRTSHAGGSAFWGDVIAIVALDESEFTDIAAARQQVRDWFAEEVA